MVFRRRGLSANAGGGRSFRNHEMDDAVRICRNSAKGAIFGGAEMKFGVAMTAIICGGGSINPAVTDPHQPG